MRALPLVLLVACGGRSPRGPAPTNHHPATAQADAGQTIATDDVPTVETLAARGAAEAPMMREAARASEINAPIELQAGPLDTCYRAIVAANEAVTAWFEGDDRDRRGAVFSGTNGFVPPAGPVCFRKGSRLRLIVARTTERSTRSTVRAVVWAAP